MSVPRYPNETEAEPVHPDGAQAALDAGPSCGTCLGTGLVGTGTPYDVNPCPDCAVHPVDALVEAAAQMYPGQEMNPEQLAMARAHYDDPETVALLTDMRNQIADLEVRLEAERTLRAQASADLEREKGRERERRIQGDALARDRLWAIDALVEALGPLAGFATEEDGRVSGMTAPVCLAMSSVRRADALVKLHRALRR